MKHALKTRHKFVASAAAIILAAGAARAATLSPEAADAVQKGIAACHQKDYALGIRFFEQARVKAPHAPEIFVNLGLAEARIPGRELRAICWLNAYLAANPNARNAAAVKTQITALDVKSQSNLAHMIELLQDEAAQMPIENKDADLSDVAILWARSGDLPAAQKAAEQVKRPEWKCRALETIAAAQAQSGDFTAAAMSVDQIDVPRYKISALIDLAAAQSDAYKTADGDRTFIAAQSLVDALDDPAEKDRSQAQLSAAEADAGYIRRAQMSVKFVQAPASRKDTTTHIDAVNAAGRRATDLRKIAEQQAAAGNRPGAAGFLDSARHPAAQIVNDSARCDAFLAIAADQAKIGDVAAANQSLANAQDAVAPVLADDQAAAQHAIAKAVEDIRRTLLAGPAPATADALFDPAVFIWLEKLDDDNSKPQNFDYLVGSPCPLATEPFLDFPHFLASLRSSASPQHLFDSQRAATWQILRAQNVISHMLAHHPQH